MSFMYSWTIYNIFTVLFFLVFFLCITSYSCRCLFLLIVCDCIAICLLVGWLFQLVFWIGRFFLLSLLLVFSGVGFGFILIKYALFRLNTFSCVFFTLVSTSWCVYVCYCSWCPLLVLRNVFYFVSYVKFSVALVSMFVKAIHLFILQFLYLYFLWCLCLWTQIIWFWWHFGSQPTVHQ